MNAMKHPGMQATVSALSALGFKKRAGGILTIEIGEGVLGWVGLNVSSTAAKIGVLPVNPVIGVRHQAVEQTVAELRGMKAHPYAPPTYARPLSALADNISANSFILHDDEGDEQTVAGLVEAVETYGLPFMHQYADHQQLATALLDRAAHEDGARERHAVLLFLDDDTAGATRAILEASEALSTRSDRAAKDLLDSLAGLSDRLEALD